ncbi:MAG: hypothetical protein P8H36_02275, partial [Yoonia sp.]|nr:hypothetical protein [Yoonia sp.]
MMRLSEWARPHCGQATLVQVLGLRPQQALGPQQLARGLGPRRRMLVGSCTTDCGGVTAAVAVAAAPIVTVPTPAPAPHQSKTAFCVGRTGLQPGFVSSSTGQTIDCDGVRTAPVVRTAAVADTPLRMTMAQVCAEMRSTGRQFV